MARLRLPVTLAVVLILAPAGCTRRPVAEPTTLVLLDIGPTRNTDYSDWMERALVGFHRETGVAVKRVLAPESSDEQLVLERQLLEGGATTPDVYIIDAIWPGVLGEHFIDLRPRLAAEAALHFPALVANNVVQGRLVAMPYHANVGILYYRTDLLREYGYGAPPSTWTELEGMAAAIQKGERAKGHEGFWGYVWQGAPYEGLTCNALEWQESEGGGRIVEDDGTISVDNPRTVAAWSRAASWVGTISPPAVVGYREGDAQEVWRSGRAAFMRSWPYAGRDRGSSVRGRFDITTVPRGARGHAMVLGENALAVSRYSKHVDPGVALVKYLTRRDVQLDRARTTALPPTLSALYDDPEILKTSPDDMPLQKIFLASAVSRPSSVTGRKYADVSRAYFRAVHSVLTRQQKPSAAAATLERELVWITGLPTRRLSPGAPGFAAPGS
jgi:trehalose/maltose transport system substrate-binding protein